MDTIYFENKVKKDGFIRFTVRFPPQQQVKLQRVSKPNTLRYYQMVRIFEVEQRHDSSIVMRANAGEQFTITSEVGDWYEITIPTGESAFVAKWVVSVSVEDLNRCEY